MTRRPESFNEVAALYDRARPLYPQPLIDDLLALTGVRAGDHVLEIGCGTGQITLPLAERGLTITALEPGADLAAQVERVAVRTDPPVRLDDRQVAAGPERRG